MPAPWQAPDDIALEWDSLAHLRFSDAVIQTLQSARATATKWTVAFSEM